MRYKIEFELPDNDTVLKEIKHASVGWQIWGYSGIAKPVPAIDAVPVIRCKDCKYASPNTVYGCVLGRFSVHDKNVRMYSEDYCSRAERKES